MRMMIAVIVFLMALASFVVNADPTSIPPAVVSYVTISNDTLRQVWPPVDSWAASNGIALSSNLSDVIRSSSNNVFTGTTNTFQGGVRIIRDAPLRTGGYDVFIESYGTNPPTAGAAVGPAFTGRRARGTFANPTNVESGDILALISGRGYGDTGFNPLSDVQIALSATERHTDTAHGTRIDFKTTLMGGTDRVTRAYIADDGLYAYRGFRTLTGAYRDDEWITSGDVNFKLAALSDITLYGSTNAHPVLANTASLVLTNPAVTQARTYPVVAGTNYLGRFAYSSPLSGGLLRGSYHRMSYAYKSSQAISAVLVFALEAVSPTSTNVLATSGVSNPLEKDVVKLYEAYIQLMTNYITSATNEYLAVSRYCISGGSQDITVYAGDGYPSMLYLPTLDFSSAGVQSFNGRAGAVTLTSNDVASAGGVLTNRTIAVNGTTQALSGDISFTVSDTGVTNLIPTNAVVGASRITGRDLILGTNVPSGAETLWIAASNAVVYTNRTIAINGTTQALSANLSFTVTAAGDGGVTNLIYTNDVVGASRISDRDFILGTNTPAGSGTFTMPLSITGEEFVVKIYNTNILIATHVGYSPGPNVSGTYERDYETPFYFLATGLTMSSPDGGASWYIYPNGTDITWGNNSGRPDGIYTPLAPGEDGTPYGTVTVVYAVLTNLVFADSDGIRATHLGGLPAGSYPTGMTVNGQAATMTNQNLEVTIPVGGETVAPYPEFLLTLGGAWTDFEIKASTNNFGRPAVLQYVVTGTAAADTYTLTTNLYDGFVVLLGSGDNAIWHNASAWHVGYGWTGGGAGETALAGTISSAVLPPTGVWSQEFGGEDATVTLKSSDPGVVYYYSSWMPPISGYGDPDPYAYFTEDNVGDVRAWRKQLPGLPISKQIDQYSVVPRVYFSPSTNFPKYGDWMNKTNNHVVWSYIIVDDLGFRTNPVSGNQTWELIQPYNWAKDRVVP